MKTRQKIIVFGSTGLVGHHLGKALSQGLASPRLLFPVRTIPENQLQGQYVPFDFEDPKKYIEILQRSDWVVCCLGTTLANAGSKEAQWQVDHDYVLAIAQAARQAEVERFMVVSSMGASPRSPVFYNRMKGQMEEDLKALGFTSLVILRPSMLLGERQEQRPLEDFGKILMRWTNFLYTGPFRKYRAIPAEQVAQKMAELIKNPTEGQRTLESDELWETSTQA